MTNPLQHFDFRKSTYQRPNQTWVCGRMVDGNPCQIGPDIKGNCQAHHECQPSRNKDRWQCNRSESSGGKCDEGPMPDGTCCRAIPRCQPIRSWRGRIRSIRNWVFIASVGLLLTALSSPFTSNFLNPGNVTFQHGEIADCTVCHSAHNKSVLSWPLAVFTQSTKDKDNELCIACHDLGKNPSDPHGLPSDTLSALTKTADTNNVTGQPLLLTAASWARDLPLHDDTGIACSTCHQEHNGKAFELTAMSNKQCVACHVVHFSALSRGHPEFTNFPFDRRTRINFDHGSHLGTHFQTTEFKEHAPQQCTTCHVPEDTGRNMVVKEFETMCTACHGAQIVGFGRATSKGHKIFSVPGLDVTALEERNVPIGQWPEDAEGGITPYMDILLAMDQEYRIAKLNLQGLDLLDLENASDEEIANIERLAWSIKELYFDLATKGIAALQSRFENALGYELGSDELARLTNLLPMDGIMAAKNLWFPSLLDEVRRHRDGEIVAIQNISQIDSFGSLSNVVKGSSKNGQNIGLSDDEIGDDEIGDDDIEEEEVGDDEDTNIKSVINEDWASAGGWYREGFSLRYRPSGHADTFIRSWLDISGQATTNLSKDSTVEIFENLSNAKSPGICSKCHSVDVIGTGLYKVNWESKRRIPNQQTFTAFSHVSHFTLLDERGCLTCHSLNLEAEFADGYKNSDPMTFSSNFNPVERTTCAACHTAAEAGDNCVTCHNYHIGIFPPAQTNTHKMMKQAQN